MTQMVTIPRVRLYELLKEQGLILTEMRDPAHTVWYNKKDGQHYLVPEHDQYSPSVISDLLHHILGTKPKEITEVIDEKVFQVYHR